MTIQTLIDKQDAFEIVRDKVAQILADESAAQMVLATAAAQDPELWRLDVYLERANPWEKWLNSPELANVAPIINVWFDSDSFSQSNGSTVDCQAADGTIHIDCYGFGISEDDGATGHTPGDELAAKESHRAVRLVRNILMAAEYTYLDLRPLVSRRWTQARTSFQPQIDGRTVQRIVATRLALSVKYLERAPQVVGGALDCMHIELKQLSDGRVLSELEYGDGCVLPDLCDCTPTHLDDTNWDGRISSPFGNVYNWNTLEQEWGTFAEDYGTPATGHVLMTAFFEWAAGFRPTEMRICIYVGPDTTFTPNSFPSSVDIFLEDGESNVIGSGFTIFTAEGKENLVTIVMPLTFVSEASEHDITSLFLDPDMYITGPNITCIEFVGDTYV